MIDRLSESHLMTESFASLQRSDFTRSSRIGGIISLIHSLQL